MMSPSPEELVLSDTHRAEQFSDGVFAIVITLLVLDLRSPVTRPGHLLRGLLDQWPTYLAYVTSFLYVGVVFLNHKAAFHRIRIMDRGLHWANLGVLFTTALLPFPTAVLSHAAQSANGSDARTAVGFYALVGALLCWSWLVFFHHLGRHPYLVNEDVEDGFFLRERLRALIGVAAYVAAGLLGCLVAPPVASAIFLALPVFYGVTSHGLTELPDVVRRALPRS